MFQLADIVSRKPSLKVTRVCLRVLPSPRRVYTRAHDSSGGQEGEEGGWTLPINAAALKLHDPVGILLREAACVPRTWMEEGKSEVGGR